MFGVRLGNVLEVIDTEKQHPSGAKFLRFRDITLVPYEPKLIERALLSTQEVRTPRFQSSRCNQYKCIKYVHRNDGLTTIMPEYVIWLAKSLKYR